MIATRDRLLAAATKLFAEVGFSAGSTDAVVRAAKVNKRMIYHYFGDKDGLAREVLSAQWQAFAVSLAASQWQSSAERALDTFFDFAVSHPDFLRLVMWDALAGSLHSRALWGNTRGPLFTQIVGMMTPGRKNAKQSDALAQTIISVLGATAFYFAFAPSLADVFRVDPLSPAALRRRRAHLHALLAHLTAR